MDVEKLIENKIEEDERILAKFHYKKVAYTSTYNVVATPAIYHYYFFATNRKTHRSFL